MYLLINYKSLICALRYYELPFKTHPLLQYVNLKHLMTPALIRFTHPLFFLFLFASCASTKPASSFENGSPKLSAIDFFGDITNSTGVIENRAGKPTHRITTHTEGKIVDGELTLKQQLKTEGGKTNNRTWQLRQIDEHHINATSNDIAGTAKGTLYGNHFSWAFRLKTGKKLVRHVRMSQNYYLMPGGDRLIIRSVIKKWGITILQITEEFVKEAKN